MNTPEVIYKGGYPYKRYIHPETQQAEGEQKSRDFLQKMQLRRSLRHFSDQDVPQSLIENLLLTAGTAPSGAHKQPWSFCAISNAALKQQIRIAAEKEEYDSYNSRMPQSWLQDLAPLGTDWRKPFLETAPWIIIVFKRVYERQLDGSKRNNYYVNESVGIACGFLITAIHEAGLVTLTHTPSPMNFLSTILKRPENERPYLLLPVGYPADPAYIPDIKRKQLDEICSFYI